MEVKTFEHIKTTVKRKDSAGVAIVWQPSKEVEPKILLIHPTNSSWHANTMGIPKGQVENDEDILNAALREVYEEVGIKLTLDQVDKSIQSIPVFYNSEPSHYFHYVVCKIFKLSEIGLTTPTVPKVQLQISEVDWAGFIIIRDAYAMVTQVQRLLLDRLS